MEPTVHHPRLWYSQQTITNQVKSSFHNDIHALSNFASAVAFSTVVSPIPLFSNKSYGEIWHKINKGAMGKQEKTENVPYRKYMNFFRNKFHTFDDSKL